MAARDPEATKARIFEAAVAEFARHGIAGARVDRIAAEAKANKQLIYAYYGNKAELFASVLEKKMVDLAISVPVDPDDIEGWIDRLLDYHAAHPELLRLLFWEGMEYGTAELPHEAERQDHYARKVAAVRDGQRRGVVTDAVPAPDLLFLLVAMANWASVMPQMKRILVGGEDADADRLRSSIKKAARLIVDG
ncbi:MULTISPECIES: TetR family transcriptional regulator [Streptomyces]|jgi:AcrR family transcriptional regulator|uniref:TetR family transcriptional regulator n=3 Tax=Streptomyces rochei group TaxID=2867164 RepID=A0AAX3ZLE8_STRRO|nr:MULTISPECIES: TetR family transcriptional regulator [Streptomyces]MBD2817225.1 TetR/AcrR family transcriptional regulator [Streptomyces parvulus]MDV6289207.1 TetR family transcriptional regulator [Streptomyces sp. UP1A-1]WDI19316.1 TetR family transcriptional regulator [Streptomyces enissocaesilis]KYK17208.1 TetR family transcriptional regulator [Streptomyces sp. CC71]MBJ6620366.1 TetR/AcrR family transcriptional regulator [Streptomyces sp. DHE17-7]